MHCFYVSAQVPFSKMFAHRCACIMWVSWSKALAHQVSGPNPRLRSDFYSCKAGLRLPHCKSVLRFYGGPIEDLAHGWPTTALSLPSLNSRKVALSRREETCLLHCLSKKSVTKFKFGLKVVDNKSVLLPRGMDVSSMRGQVPFAILELPPSRPVK